MSNKPALKVLALTPSAVPGFSGAFIGSLTAGIGAAADNGNFRTGVKKPVTSFSGPVDFLSDNVVYQIAYALAYAHYYHTYDIHDYELFNYKSLIMASVPRSSYVREMNINNIKIIMPYSDPNNLVDDVYFHTLAQMKDKLITDPTVNIEWFSFSGDNSTGLSPYSIRLHGTKGNIITLYFEDDKTLMKWENFINDPYNFSGGF